MTETYLYDALQAVQTTNPSQTFFTGPGGEAGGSRPWTPEQWGQQQILEHWRTFEIFRKLRMEKGNFGLGSGTAEEAMKWREDWVGPGYKLMRGRAGFVSADGLRQFDFRVLSQD